MYVSFEKAMYEYFIYLKLKLKCTTYETNYRKINIYILSYFKDKNIFEFTVKDYLDWQLFINSKKFSFNYKSSLFYCFCGFLDYCITFFNLDKNVARMVGNFKNDSMITTGNIWTINDFYKFINSVDNLKYNTLFSLLFFTGMRKGEALALTWNDIDFTNQTIFINKSRTRLHNSDGSIVITRPKSNRSIRVISIDDNLTNKLNELKNSYTHSQFNSSYFIFGFKNKPLSFTTLDRLKNSYCDKANVKRIKIHEFRHSHACLLFMNDIPVEDISYRLGHSSLSMTMDTYLKYLPRNEKRVINTLNSL